MDWNPILYAVVILVTLGLLRFIGQRFWDGFLTWLKRELARDRESPPSGDD